MQRPVAADGGTKVGDALVWFRENLHFRENADFRIRISPLAPAPGHVRAAPPPFPTYSRGSAPARSRTPIPGIISFASATRGGESFGAPGHDMAVVPGAISRLSLQSGETAGAISRRSLQSGEGKRQARVRSQHQAARQGAPRYPRPGGLDSRAGGLVINLAQLLSSCLRCLALSFGPLTAAEHEGGRGLGKALPP